MLFGEVRGGARSGCSASWPSHGAFTGPHVFVASPRPSSVSRWSQGEGVDDNLYSETKSNFFLGALNPGYKPSEATGVGHKEYVNGEVQGT